MDDPESRQRSNQRPATALGGCAATGLLVTGVMGLGMMGVRAWNGSDAVAGAVALVASALAFGFLINGIYRR
jgi:hypothetical protein